MVRETEVESMKMYTNLSISEVWDHWFNIHANRTMVRNDSKVKMLKVLKQTTSLIEFVRKSALLWKKMTFLFINFFVYIYIYICYR